MQNSIKLSAKDKNSLGKTTEQLTFEAGSKVAKVENEKLMTTKELAEKLGTKPNVITENAKKCIPNKKIENGKTTYWNEQEATVILECIKNNKVGAGVNLSNHLIGVSTELTPALKIKKAMELMQEGYEEELSILRAKNAEMQPKAIVYDKICNADGLKSVEQVASNLGWGKNNFFALMRGMGIFFYSSKDADGRKVNLPKREYVERGYFVTKEEPYTRGDKDLLYTKIYVTGKGETWLANKLNEAVEDSAGRLIEKIAK